MALDLESWSGAKNYSEPGSRSVTVTVSFLYPLGQFVSGRYRSYNLMFINLLVRNLDKRFYTLSMPVLCLLSY